MKENILSLEKDSMALQTFNPETTLISRANTPALSSIDMSRVATIILGGGQGSRLYPLTATRCKPAVSFLGKYNIIDFPISNALNSHIQRIFIVTQFLSASLHRHIFKTYPPHSFSSGFIEVLAAEEKPTKRAWFQGTADAVRQNLEYFLETPADYFLILSGDQIYHLDFREMVHHAQVTQADLTVACLPISGQDAQRMGIMAVDEHLNITRFVEKPQDPEVLAEFALDSEALQNIGNAADSEKKWLGSMGIYLFKRQALFDLLEQDLREDFGKHLIPTKVKQGSVTAFPHQGYWEDIGTIESFYQANLAQTKAYPQFSLYDEANPIYSCRATLPPAKIYGTKVTDSIISEGCIVEGKEVTNSILGPRTVVHSGAVIQDSYIMGNDFYRPTMHNLDHLPSHLDIGKNTIIKKAIIDRNVKIGNNVELVNKQNLDNHHVGHIHVRDGVIIVPRGSEIPDGFKF
ncbi:MAG: glgC [Chlamydiales bacterium]|jgi:glucose-1-phosphate adenylyltransferase|nr:glgC [Chlamydiales bacterium]